MHLKLRGNQLITDIQANKEQSLASSYSLFNMGQRPLNRQLFNSMTNAMTSKRGILTIQLWWRMGVRISHKSSFPHHFLWSETHKSTASIKFGLDLGKRG